MKLNYLFGAVAACGLIAGAAYAQSSSTSPSDTTSGSSMSAPATGSDMSGASTSSTTSGAATPAPADNTAAPSAQSSTGAASAETQGQPASATTSETTNGPVPDTKENRQKYGGPMSNAGRRTAAKGN